MPVKEFRENLVLAAILLALFLWIRDSFPWLGMLCVCSLYAYRTSFRSAACLLVLCLCLFPLRTAEDTFIKEARIIEIHQNYAVAKSGMNKVLVYSDGPLPLDAVVAIDGKTEPIRSHQSFFGFDFASMMRNKGVRVQYCGDQLTILHETDTPRRMLQKRIERIEDPEIRAFVYKVLFNCTDDDMISGRFLSMSGFSFAGMMAVLETMLKYLCDDQKRRKIMIAVNIGLILFYGPFMILISSLIRKLLSMIHMDGREKSALWIILMILIFRRQIFSAAFLFPFCFAAGSFAEEDEVYTKYTFLFVMQSILNHKIDLFQSISYPIILKISGILWIYGLLIACFPFLASESLIHMISSLSLVTDKLCIYGSVIGTGLPFFLLFIFSFYSHEHFAKITLASLIIFLSCGLFHPFAEVCFINVGQGDCILIRAPFGLDNVLIDTGKSSQYEHVKAAFYARGIHKIDTFFVTHMDSDHCGSMDAIMNDFKVERKITEHEGTTISDLLVFHDLNSIESEDKNQSSLVLAFRLGGLDFVCSGDADQTAEEAIAYSYPLLRADVYKLSHHGSSTGSCDRFLDTLKPSLGIISSGAYQIYHHPSVETVQRLLKRHIPYLDTKVHGDISILMIGPLRIVITSDLCFDVL